MHSIITTSEKETKALAFSFSEEILSGFKNRKRAVVVALNGELGAGKTTFAQGFAKGLGVREKVKSPTFIILRQHKIPQTKQNTQTPFQYFYHVDCYRPEDKKTFSDIGLPEIMEDKKNIVLIEWADKIKDIIKPPRITINISQTNEKTRKISFS